MDPSLQLLFDEICRRFDEMDARWEQRFTGTRAPQEQQDSAADPHVGNPKCSTVVPSDVPVAADNWGGLFDDIPAAFHEPVPAPEATSTGSDAPPFALAPDAVFNFEFAASDKELEVVELDEMCIREFLVDDLSTPRPLRLRWLRHAPPRPPLIRRPRAARPHPPRLRGAQHPHLRPLRLHRPRRAPLRPPRLRRQRRAPPRPPWLCHPRSPWSHGSRRAPPWHRRPLRRLICPPRLRRPQQAPPRRRGRPPRLSVRGCRPRLRARVLLLWLGAVLRPVRAPPRRRRGRARRAVRVALLQPHHGLRQRRDRVPRSPADVAYHTGSTTLFPNTAGSNISISYIPKSAPAVTASPTTSSTASLDSVPSAAPANVLASSIVRAQWVFDEIPKRYIMNFTHEHSVGGLISGSASKTHDAHRVFEGMLMQNPVQLMTRGVHVQCRPIPWPSFSDCAASVQLEIQSNGVQLRPTPWPSFIGNTVQVADITQWPCWNSECTFARSLFHLHLITAGRVKMLVVNRDSTGFKVHWPLPACVGGTIRKGAIQLTVILQCAPRQADMSNCWLALFSFTLQIELKLGPNWYRHEVNQDTARLCSLAARLQCGGLTHFDSIALSNGFVISFGGLIAEMRPVSSMKNHQLFSMDALINVNMLTFSVVLHLECCSKTNRHSCELCSISMLLIHSMFLHESTILVQAPTVGVVWVLLALNFLDHAEFQFNFEIEKMVGTGICVCLTTTQSHSCNQLALVHLIYEEYGSGNDQRRVMAVMFVPRLISAQVLFQYGSARVFAQVSVQFSALLFAKTVPLVPHACLYPTFAEHDHSLKKVLQFLWYYSTLLSWKCGAVGSLFSVISSTAIQFPTLLLKQIFSHAVIGYGPFFKGATRIQTTDILGDHIPSILVQHWEFTTDLQEVSGQQYGFEVTCILPSLVHKHLMQAELVKSVLQAQLCLFEEAHDAILSYHCYLIEQAVKFQKADTGISVNSCDGQLLFHWTFNQVSLLYRWHQVILMVVAYGYRRGICEDRSIINGKICIGAPGCRISHPLLLFENTNFEVPCTDLKALLDCTLITVLALDCSIALQPWPPPEILLNILFNSELAETCSITSKLYVLDRVVVAQLPLEITCAIYVSIRTKCNQRKFIVQSCHGNNQTSRACVHITIENSCQKTIGMQSIVDCNLLEANATSASRSSVHAEYESIDLDLQVPWDPGALFHHLQALVHWLEGKPILKEGGMSVHCQVGPVHCRVGPECQDSYGNSTKGDRPAPEEGTKNYSELYLLLAITVYLLPFNVLHQSSSSIPLLASIS